MIGKPISELTVGQTAELTREVSFRMITDFAGTIGDENPIHSDRTFAKRVSFKEPIAPGILSGGLISAAIGTLLPGPGTLYMSQELKFMKPVFAGDTITARVEVLELMPERNRAKLKTVCVNQRGEEVLIGEAWVKPPKEKIIYEEAPAASTAPLVWSAWSQMWTRAAMSLFGRA